MVTTLFRNTLYRGEELEALPDEVRHRMGHRDGVAEALPGTVLPRRRVEAEAVLWRETVAVPAPHPAAPAAPAALAPALVIV